MLFLNVFFFGTFIRALVRVTIGGIAGKAYSGELLIGISPKGLTKKLLDRSYGGISDSELMLTWIPASKRCLFNVFLQL